MTDGTRTVFLGSGEFAVAPAQALLDHTEIDLAAVVTAPPRPAGRGGKLRPTPVALWAASRGLPTLTPARLRDPDSLAGLAELAPDLIVLADYGQIVPAGLLDLPRHGALNLHPSLLPRHRGASPVPAAILAGDSETGVTLMLMDAGLDSGPIVAQQRVPLTGTETAPELEAALSNVAAVLLSESLGPWLAGAIFPESQPDDGVTLTRLLRRDDGRLVQTRTAVELERQVRAYQPWPGSFLEVDGRRLVVWQARQLDALPSTGLAIPTPDGALELLEVQPAGGRRMSGAEFARGRPGPLALG